MAKSDSRGFETATFNVAKYYNYFTERPVSNYRDILTGDGGVIASVNSGLLERDILNGGQKCYPSTPTKT